MVPGSVGVSLVRNMATPLDDGLARVLFLTPGLLFRAQGLVFLKAQAAAAAQIADARHRGGEWTRAWPRWLWVLPGR